jgi:hypothetical protein
LRTFQPLQDGAAGPLVSGALFDQFGQRSPHFVEFALSRVEFGELLAGKILHRAAFAMLVAP